jgi:D-glycero-D-manno-heptose 1,7-bisphosphate phosphatase
MGVHALIQRAVFLDRDGVINRAIMRDGKPFPPASFDELEILPGVAWALKRLRQEGLRLIVVTNQPDVARGTQTRQAVEAIHTKLLSAGLPIDAFYVCYHDSSDECPCRKPRPGMLLAAMQDHNLDVKSSFIVGDRWRDIQAGQTVGCTAFFIDYGYNERKPTPPYVRVDSLRQAAECILACVRGSQAYAEARTTEYQDIRGRRA